VNLPDDLTALDLATDWWVDQMDIDYGHATEEQVIKAARSCPWAAHHLAVLERSTPDGGDPTLLLLLDTIAEYHP